MKRILTYTIFCLLFVLTSCSEEQLDVYNGDNYVYFTYMSDKSCLLYTSDAADE